MNLQHSGRLQTASLQTVSLQTVSLRKLQGFTLIEVLVVVAIIGLLVALLVPSLARSRENARSVICQANLKEWGKAMLMYSDQYKNTLPFEDRPNAEATPSEDADGDKVFDVEGYICWFDALDRYLGASRGATADINVKTCPTVSRGEVGIEESYRMNSKLAESNDLSEYFQPYRHLDSLRRPQQTVVLFDGDVGGDRITFKGRWRLNSGSTSKSDDVSYRHNKSADFLFADWHVEKINKKNVELKSMVNQPMIWQPADMGTWVASPNE